MKKSRVILGLFIIIIVALIAAILLLNQKSTKNSNRTSTSKPVSQFSWNPKTSDWNLLLVNSKNVLKQDPTFTKVEAGAPYNGSGNIYIDERILNKLREFRKAALDAGYQTIFVSGYRSFDTQKQLFQSAGGFNQNPVLVQQPGASEHETGLAFDLVGSAAWNKVGALKASELEENVDQQWLIKNAPKYGFILRYPDGTKAFDKTGIDYESWHFRYVGVKNAEYISKNNLTLEDYIVLIGQK